MDYYRLNLKMPVMDKDYLQEVAWRNRTSVTGYLVKLIHEDMDKNGAIVRELAAKKHE